MARILIVDDCMPVRSRGYGFPRADTILKGLQNLGHRVEILPLQSILEGKKSDGPGDCGVLWSLPDEAFASLSSDCILWISRLKNLQWVRENYRQALLKHPWVYDIEAINSTREGLRREILGLAFDLESAIQAEMQLFQDAPGKVAASVLDKEMLEARGILGIQSLGHSINVKETSADFSTRKNCLFVGSFFGIDGLSPNRDAVLYFVEKVWPLVRKNITDCSLTIAGYGASRLYEYGLPLLPEIEVLDGVKDLGTLYSKHRLLVAPTRFASGIPWKVHEALGAGLPVVVSTLLANQLAAENRDYAEYFSSCSAAASDQLAAKIVETYRDQESWEELRQLGLEYVKRTCNPESFLRQLSAAVEKCEGCAVRRA